MCMSLLCATCAQFPHPPKSRALWLQGAPHLPQHAPLNCFPSASGGASHLFLCCVPPALCTADPQESRALRLQDAPRHARQHARQASCPGRSSAGGPGAAQRAHPGTVRHGEAGHGISRCLASGSSAVLWLSKQSPGLCIVPALHPPGHWVLKFKPFYFG